MLFSSLTFIFLFLPLCCLFYFISKTNIKNIILLIFSLIFYSWGEPKYVVLMLFTVFISWVAGLLIDKFEKSKEYKLKKLTFIISIILIISSLLYFKYTNFFISNLNSLFSLKIPTMNIILPIGISFYTFQILSYVIDLYRKKIKVQKSVFNLALYISFFPQLIAGPIVKYETIEEQLNNRKESFEKIVSGVERFILGLGKKVIIANNMALIADAIFDSRVLYSYSSFVLILGIIAYTFQIYFDFSGYSDMAIGLGKIFGFEFLENFDYPYMSNSITDFWKRWHMSLTTFFREYIYIPLGGNRVKKSRWILNMLLVWLLTGLWHGASWTFILWGLYYFIFLIIERVWLKDKIEKIPNILRHIITLIIVGIGWTLFRANNLIDFINILKGLFVNFNSIGLRQLINTNADVASSMPYIVFAVLFSFNLYPTLEKKYSNSFAYNIVKRIVLLCIFVTCIALLVSSMYNPFIYFRF